MIIKVLMVSSTSYRLSKITVETCVVPLPVKPALKLKYAKLHTPT